MNFQSLLKKLKIDETFTKESNTKQKVFNKFKNNLPMGEDINHMADILYLPQTKEKYKFLLVVCDLATHEFDIEPLKTRNSDEVATAYKTMMKRPYLKFPEFIKTDDGAEFKKAFNKLLEKYEVVHKISRPSRHKQMAPVESLNKQLGRVFNGYMNKKEIETGKTYREWTDVLDIVRKNLNKYRKVKLNKSIDEYDYGEFNPPRKSKFSVGDVVHEKLDYPEDALGRKQPTENFRTGDIRYSMVPKTITKIILMQDEPYYRYMLSGIKNASYSEHELIKSTLRKDVRKKK